MTKPRAVLRFRRIITTVGLLSLFGAPVWAQNAQPPKYSADVPSSITTPDTVETRIGTLRFHDGAPDKKTIMTVYDQIDFSRGIEAFLTGMSGTSVYALCDGFNQVGIKTNQGIGISADLLDARSLFLTANTTTVYVVFCIDLKDGPMVVGIPRRGEIFSNFSSTRLELQHEPACRLLGHIATLV
jgi:hypothetical protein